MSGSSPGAGTETRHLPTGFLAFMFTDIEGSTRLAHLLSPETFGDVISRHNALIRDKVGKGAGTEVSTEGDAFFAVFDDELAAAETAIAIQRAIASEVWPNSLELRVRIGLHAGEAVLGGDNYIGVDVHRASRIAHAAHGGQITLSESMTSSLATRLPGSAEIIELGKFRLAGFREAEPIFQLTAEDLPAEFPPLRGVGSVSHLPVQLTSFVGREHELALGERLLSDQRLLTLTGPGGTGKTRLSIELAGRVEAQYRDGAHFVSLASISDPALIGPSTLEDLELHTAPAADPTEHLIGYLADKQLLIVLDNLEQLLPAAAAVVSQMLERAPGLKVIATSRSPLKIRGEREISVPPLDVPGKRAEDLDEAMRFAGVSLFLDRAIAVQPEFELTRQNVTTVAELANRLDGLPLAIELAASRLRSFTPEVILQRLGDRMLESQSPDLPARQQTIVRTIGWSYDLLDEESRLVFERCSVFSGSFELEQAESVINSDTEQVNVLSGLASLVESSLLQRVTDAGLSRYRMLVVIKEYAYAALAARGEVDDCERRHAAVYTELAESAATEILSSRQKVWLDRLSVEHDNFRAALDRATRESDTSTALRLVAALWRFWQIRGHLPEARSRATAALALEGGEPRERAKALLALGGIQYWQGLWTETLEPLAEALALLREHGEEAEIAEAAYSLSFPVGFSGDSDAAEELLLEALEISRKLGDRVGVSRAYWGLGDLAGYRKDWDRELELMQEATRQLEGEDAPFDRGWALFMTAYGYQHNGADQAAREQLLRALDIFEGMLDLSALTLIFESLGLNALRRGDKLTAAKLAGAAQRIKEDTGVAITEVPMNRYEDFDDLLQSDDVTTRTAFEEGMEMSLEEVLLLARS